MADPGLIKEAQRRGLVPSEPPSGLIEEARRRGLIAAEDSESAPENNAVVSAFEGAVDATTKVAADAYDAAKNLVTGDDSREFEYPELPGFMTPSGVPRARMALGRDDLRKLDILRKTAKDNIPGRADRFGNVYVEIDKERAKKYNIDPGKFYLNRPGASVQDLEDVLTTGAITAATTLGPAKVLGKLMPAGRVLGAGLGAGAGSIVQDELADQAGSERGIDPEAALIASAFGGAGEAGRLDLRDSRLGCRRGGEP